MVVESLRAKMEPEVLTIKPNETTRLSLSEAYQNSLANLMDVEDKDSLVFLCRVLIQDENEFGIVLPAELEEIKTINFSLPEQLCIFNPNKTYIVKAEMVFEDQLLTPFLSQCRIVLEDLAEPEDDLDEEEDEKQSQASEEPLEDDLEDVLNVIAPTPIAEQKKMKLEDIAKTLDGEFVKHILFNSPQKQEAPAPVKVPELPVVELTPEKLALKQRVKSLLKGMLD